MDFRCDYRDQRIVFYFRDGEMMSIFDVKVTNAVMIAHEILEVSGYDYRTIEKRFHDLQIRFNKSEEANKKLATEANKLRNDNLELAVQLDLARAAGRIL